MTSLSSSDPHASLLDGPALNEPQDQLLLEEQRSVIPLSAFYVEGVGRGNLDSLRFRPFADFHPVERVELSAERCELIYERPIQSLHTRRSVSLDEVITLTRQLIEGKRRAVGGQPLYLYPGLEAFGLDPSNSRLRFRLINVRPKARFKASSHDQLSVEALCVLMEALCPAGWQRVASKRAQLQTPEGLLRLLEPSGAWRAAWGVARFTLASALLLTFLSVPLAIWGPAEVSEPLQEVMMPRVEAFLDALEERRALLKPRAQMSVTLALTLPELREGEHSATERAALVSSLERALKGLSGAHHRLLTPSDELLSTPSAVWRAEVMSYRGDINELITQLTHTTSAQLNGARLLTPSEARVEVAFEAQLGVSTPVVEGGVPQEAEEPQGAGAP
jgi:hypothetical protein